MKKLPSSVDSEEVREEILDWLALREGFSPRPYRDPNGTQWNIGYGHMLDTSIPGWQKARWSKELARKQLENDWKAHRNAAKNKVGDARLGERTIDLLGMLHFNGGGRYLGSKRFQKLLAEGQEESVIADTIRLSTIHGKEDRDLKDRRKKEIAWAAGGSFPKSLKGEVSSEPKIPDPIPEEDREEKGLWEKVRDWFGFGSGEEKVVGEPATLGWSEKLSGKNEVAVAPTVTATPTPIEKKYKATPVPVVTPTKVSSTGVQKDLDAVDKILSEEELSVENVSAESNEKSIDGQRAQSDQIDKMQLPQEKVGVWEKDLRDSVWQKYRLGEKAPENMTTEDILRKVYEKTSADSSSSSQTLDASLRKYRTSGQSQLKRNPE